jgi:hypothetical protein
MKVGEEGDDDDTVLIIKKMESVRQTRDIRRRMFFRSGFLVASTALILCKTAMYKIIE